MRPASACFSGLAVAEHGGAGATELAGDVRVHDHERAAAVGDHAAVEAVERVGHHRRAEHVVDRDRPSAGARAGCAGRAPRPPP